MSTDFLGGIMVGAATAGLVLSLIGLVIVLWPPKRRSGPIWGSIPPKPEVRPPGSYVEWLDRDGTVQRKDVSGDPLSVDYFDPVNRVRLPVFREMS